MEKPEDISGKAWATAYKISEADCGCAPGRRRVNGTSHSDSCWKHTETIARVILSAIEEEREACAQAVHDIPDANDDIRGHLYALGWTSGIRAAEHAIRNRKEA